MKKQILSTCLAVSLIASTSYVSAANTETKELSGEQSAAVLGGLLLLGGIMSLHQQSVTKAEETATQKATKTVELKPGHTYVWSSGSNDTAPTIEYVESCNPAKQYKATAKLANGVADTNNSVINLASEGCSRSYDSRKQAVTESAGNAWRLNEATYKKQQAELAKAQEQAAAAAVKVVGGVLNWMFGGGSGGSSSSRSSSNRNGLYACTERCEAERENIEAICSGQSKESGWFSSSDHSNCMFKASSAEDSCKSSCYSQYR